MVGRLGGSGPLGKPPRDDVEREFERMGETVRKQRRVQPVDKGMHDDAWSRFHRENPGAVRGVNLPVGTPQAPQAPARSPQQKFQVPTPFTPEVRAQIEERQQRMRERNTPRKKLERRASAHRLDLNLIAKSKETKPKAKEAESSQYEDPIQKHLEQRDQQRSQQSRMLVDALGETTVEILGDPFGKAREGLGAKGRTGASENRPVTFEEAKRAKTLQDVLDINRRVREGKVHPSEPILGPAQDVVSFPAKITREAGGAALGAGAATLGALGKGVEAAQETAPGEWVFGRKGHENELSVLDQIDLELLHGPIPQEKILGLGLLGVTIHSRILRSLTKGEKIAKALKESRVLRVIEKAAFDTERHAVEVLGERATAKYWNADEVAKFTGMPVEEVLSKSRSGEIKNAILKVKKNANVATMEAAAAAGDYKYPASNFLNKQARERVASLRKLEAKKLEGVSIATFEDLKRSKLPEDIQRLPLKQQAEWYEKEVVNLANAVQTMGRSFELPPDVLAKMHPVDWNKAARLVYGGNSGRVLQVSEQLRRTSEEWKRPVNTVVNKIRDVTRGAQKARGLKGKALKKAAREDRELLTAYISGTGDSTRDLTKAQVASYIEGRPDLKGLAQEIKDEFFRIRATANKVADEEYLKHFNVEGGSYVPIQFKKGVKTTLEEVEPGVFKRVRTMEEGGAKQLGGGSGKQVVSTRAKSQRARTFMTPDEYIRELKARGEDFDIVKRDISDILQDYGANVGRGAIGKRAIKTVKEIRSADGLPFITTRKALPEGANINDFVKVRNKVFDEAFPDARDVLIHKSIYKEVDKLIRRNEPTSATLNALHNISQITKGAELFGSFFHGWAELENAFSALTRVKKPLQSVYVSKKQGNEILSSMGVASEGLLTHGTTPAGLGHAIEKHAPAWIQYQVAHGLEVEMTRAMEDVGYGVYANLLSGIVTATEDTPVLRHITRAAQKVALAPADFVFKYLVAGNKKASPALLQAEFLGGVKRMRPDGTIEFIKDSYKGMKDTDVVETVNEFVNYAYGGQPWLLFPDAKVLGKNLRDIAKDPSKWKTPLRSTRTALTDAIRPVGPRGEKILRTVFRAPDWKQSGIGVMFKYISEIENPVARKLYGTYWRNMLLALPPRWLRRGVKVGGKVVKYGGAAAVAQYGINKAFNQANVKEEDNKGIVEEVTDALGITGEGVSHVGVLTGRINVTPWINFKYDSLKFVADSVGLDTTDWKRPEGQFYVDIGKAQREAGDIALGMLGVAQSASNVLLGTDYNAGENLDAAANWALSSLSSPIRVAYEVISGKSFRVGDDFKIRELSSDLPANERIKNSFFHVAKMVIPFSARSIDPTTSMLGFNVSGGLSHNKAVKLNEKLMDSYAITGDLEQYNANAMLSVFYANQQKPGLGQKAWATAKGNLITRKRNQFFNAMKEGDTDTAFQFATQLKRLGDSRDNMLNSARAKEIDDSYILNITQSLFDSKSDHDPTLDWQRLMETGRTNLDDFKEKYNKRVGPDALNLKTDEDAINLLQDVGKKFGEKLGEYAINKQQNNAKEKNVQRPVQQEAPQRTDAQLLDPNLPVEKMTTEELKRLAAIGRR